MTGSSEEDNLDGVRKPLEEGHNYLIRMGSNRVVMKKGHELKKRIIKFKDNSGANYCRDSTLTRGRKGEMELKTRGGPVRAKAIREKRKNRERSTSCWVTSNLASSNFRSAKKISSQVTQEGVPG